jgi:uncharacterized protein
MAPVVRIAVVVAAVWVLWGMVAYFGQRGIIYPGTGIRVPSLPPLPRGADLLRIPVAGGFSEAWYFPPHGAGARRPAAILFHGNGEVIDFMLPDAEAFLALGMAVLLVEYPGYGRSVGMPSEQSITVAAVAAYDILAERKEIDSGRIIAFGRSLGCGAACALSTKRPLAALILQSPFTSIRAMAARFLLPPFLARDVFDNAGTVRVFQGPVLVFHGTRDEIIPFSHGKKVAAAAAHGTLIPLACGHNDCPPAPEAFWKTIAGFLRGGGILPD